MLNFMLHGGRKQATTNFFFLFLSLSAVPKKSTPGNTYAYIWSFQNVWKKREFILKVTFSLLSPTLVDQWMDPASPGGFRQTVLQVQSPQKSSCHSNIPTWGLASLRSWRYLLCSERVTAARKVNGGWNSFLVRPHFSFRPPTTQAINAYTLVPTVFR